jgi:hypothetical protein
MNSFVHLLVSLPHPLLYGIIGAVAAAIGGLVAAPLRNAGVRTLAAIAFAALAVYFSRPVISDFAVIDAVNEIKHYRLFAILFKLHPQAETELGHTIHSLMARPATGRIGDAKTTESADTTEAAMQIASRALIAKYFNSDILKASDNTVYKYIKYDNYIQNTLKNKPDTCVAYAMGDYVNPDELPSGSLVEMSNIKADVLESASNNPTHFVNMTVDEMASTLKDVYQHNGFPVEEIANLGNIRMMLPSEGCRALSDFSDALAALEENNASRLLKSIMASDK